MNKEMTRTQLKKFWWVLTLTATIVGVVSSAKVFGDKGYHDGFLAGRNIGQQECKSNYMTEDNFCGIVKDDGTTVDGWCVEDKPVQSKLEIPNDTTFGSQLPIEGDINFIGPLPVPTPTK